MNQQRGSVLSAASSRHCAFEHLVFAEGRTSENKSGEFSPHSIMESGYEKCRQISSL